MPVKSRTFLLRTGTGKYAKLELFISILELIHIYKGNPPVVTDLFWPASWLTFRYFVQADGSRNIRTR